MQEIDDAIGRDKSTYRVAHLGVSPAPALMHGFYTVDGYSNNYPLSTSTDSGKLLHRRLRKTKKCGYTLIHGEPLLSVQQHYRQLHAPAKGKHTGL